MIIGVAGCGKMGSALTRGAIEGGVFEPNDVRAYDPYPGAAENLGEGIQAVDSLKELSSAADVILVCVKPAQVAEVLQVVSDSGRNLLVISIAAGVTLAKMEEVVAGAARLIRAMPNTPALIGKGAAVFSPGESATESDREFAQKLFSAVGAAIELPENYLDAVTGISGSGPAYVYTFIEALADGALFEGIPRDKALALATQTVLGAAEMIQKSGEHPAVLRDQVTSPGGTTIAGLAALEDGNFRSTVMNAVRQATAKARELGK